MVALLQSPAESQVVTATLTPQDAMSRVPGLGDRQWQYRPLGGGLSNRNFLASSDDLRLVIRMAGEHHASSAVNRTVEVLAHRGAAEAGLAPDLLYANPDDGILIRRFVSARVWQEEDLGRASQLHRLAGLLRRVHALPATGERFDAVVAAESYADLLVRHAAGSDLVDRCVLQIHRCDTGEASALCHNDVIAANLIDDEPLQLIDWEYACDNDPMFDLASIVCYHDLGDEQTDVLLQAYCGPTGSDRLERFHCQRKICDAILYLWFSLRQLTTDNAEIAMQLERLADRIEV